MVDYNIENKNMAKIEMFQSEFDGSINITANGIEIVRLTRDGLISSITYDHQDPEIAELEKLGFKITRYPDDRWGVEYNG